MSESKRLQGALARKYLGKRGSHGISIDESNHTVNVYVEQKEAVAKLREDAGSLNVRTIEGPVPAWREATRRSFQ
jgi:hypothetical protein